MNHLFGARVDGVKQKHWGYLTADLFQERHSNHFASLQKYHEILKKQISEGTVEVETFPDLDKAENFMGDFCS